MLPSRSLQEALELTRFDGIETNLDYIRTVIRDPEFDAGGYPTSFLSRITYEPHAVEVIEPGMQTTVQDYPGRLGYWHVGRASLRTDGFSGIPHRKSIGWKSAICCGA